MSGSNTIWPISLPVSEEPESPTLTAFKFFAESSESAGIHPPICPHDLHYVFCSNALKKGFNVPLTYTNLRGEKILEKDQFTASHLELFLLMARNSRNRCHAPSSVNTVRDEKCQIIARLCANLCALHFLVAHQKQKRCAQFRLAVADGRQMICRFCS